MTAPQRRKSGLSARSPIAPATAPEVTPVPVPEPTPAPAAPPVKPSGKRPKMGFFAASEDEAGRIRAAWRHTLATEDGHNSLAQFERFAVMKLVAELEAKHNGGEPWPYVAAGDIRTGRPPGGN
ncbi:hypothetical protein [Frigoribacterium sp. CFBP 13707]|uniref:ParB family protein n=1 Tax=Frigoribacterium sp. CFBP 13707 TaxID=2775313 RepID=UPI00177F3C3D|nr:hypothetical protein [Frigoribacterium sp. CFBP 13707]MBD8729343.1 hypothetical protein [Frigoribacterium sp. CFBP 13707]